MCQSCPENRQFFHFKQFSLEQTHCAMKIGTDSVLLGAWVSLNNKAKNLLDLGTGSGLLSLMLAQRLAEKFRHEWHIFAIEKSQEAVIDAKNNFQQSPWAENCTLICGDIAQELPALKQKFDVILTNPPYFPPALACKNSARDLARYTQQSHLQWLLWAIDCANEDGEISFVLPFDAGVKLLHLAPIPCIRRCDVMTKQGKNPTRILLTFCAKAQKLKHESLVIYDENHRYTKEFIELTSSFYLKM